MSSKEGPRVRGSARPRMRPATDALAVGAPTPELEVAK